MMKKAKCPDCGKTHDIDSKTFDMFGFDCFCIKCVDWAHVRFIHKMNRKGIKFSCVKGCRCGNGN